MDMAGLLGMESLCQKSSFLNFLTFCFRDFPKLANFVGVDQGAKFDVQTESRKALSISEFVAPGVNCSRSSPKECWCLVRVREL